MLLFFIAPISAMSNLSASFNPDSAITNIDSLYNIGEVMVQGKSKTQLIREGAYAVNAIDVKSLANMTITLNDNDKQTYTFYSENGLNDLVDSAVKGKELINNRLTIRYEEGREKMDFVLTYTSNYSQTIIPYVNSGKTEKGPHITQIKTVLTREFNKFFREKKWLKDKDENLTGDDIQEGMYIVFNITAPNIAYDAQVKSTVTKIDMAPFNQALVDNLQYF